MKQPAVDTRALVEAIQREPAKLEDFLTANPRMARILATIYEELVREPGTKLAAALTALPAAPAPVNEFKELVALTNGTLEARVGTHSAYEFRLTLINVQPWQTQETLEALVAEMNARFKQMPNYPSCGYQVRLSQNGDLPNYKEVGNVVFTCSSLIRDSTERHRKDTITLNGEERISQEALLSAHGLVQVPNDVVRAVLGMYRVAQGFPNTEDDINTERDKGDVFEGNVARTKPGSSSGAAASCRDGVRDPFWRGCDFAFAFCGVVGGHSPELKQFDTRSLVS